LLFRVIAARLLLLTTLLPALLPFLTIVYLFLPALFKTLLPFLVVILTALLLFLLALLAGGLVFLPPLLAAAASSLRARKVTGSEQRGGYRQRYSQSF
jgi:hypothetical protein